MKVDDKKVEAVPELCYLGDMLSAGCGCELAAITFCKCAWGNFANCFRSLAHQPQPAASDPNWGVFNMHEKCDVACSRDLGHEGGYTELSTA